MSRALEPDVASAATLAATDAPYRELAAALRPRASAPLQIEFLPKQYPLPDGVNVLVEDVHLGVTKTTLVQAFITARQHLFAALRSAAGLPPSIMDAAAVILVLDAEHLTAANARKRFLATRDSPTLLDDELWFLDSLLTSPLHRHTKSPTLWAHRQWVMKRRLARGAAADLQRELVRVAFVAGDRHPRNYYAWSYSRWMVRAAAAATGNAPRTTCGVSRWPDLLRQCQTWCYAHSDDISGWSFLAWLLTQPTCQSSLRLVEAGNDDASAWQCEVKSCIEDVLETVQRRQWSNESVGMFLRLLVESQTIDSGLVKRIRATQNSAVTAWG